MYEAVCVVTSHPGSRIRRPRVSSSPYQKFAFPWAPRKKEGRLERGPFSTNTGLLRGEPLASYNHFAH